MKKFLPFVALAAGAALALIGCSDQKTEAKLDSEAPNLKGKPAGPPPTPSVGGAAGGAATQGGPAVQSQ